MSDPLREKLVKQLKARRVHPQMRVVELHDYDYQKRNFDRPIDPTHEVNS